MKWPLRHTENGSWRSDVKPSIKLQYFPSEISHQFVKPRKDQIHLLESVDVIAEDSFHTRYRHCVDERIILLSD